jgi:hypothetical protein
LAGPCDLGGRRQGAVSCRSAGFRSAFEDEKLYWASRLSADDAAGFPQDGPAVIEKRRLYEPGTWRSLRG